MKGRSVQRWIEAARKTRGFRAFVHVLLVAFVLQGVATQGHAHWATAGGKVLSAIAFQADAPSSASKTGSKQTPAGDHSNCPICHAASIAGAAFASSAPVLHVPSLSALLPERDERRIVVERFAAAWRSRAPPSV